MSQKVMEQKKREREREIKVCYVWLDGLQYPKGHPLVQGVGVVSGGGKGTELGAVSSQSCGCLYLQKQNNSS